MGDAKDGNARVLHRLAGRRLASRGIAEQLDELLCNTSLID